LKNQVAKKLRNKQNWIRYKKKTTHFSVGVPTTAGLHQSENPSRHSVVARHTSRERISGRCRITFKQLRYKAGNNRLVSTSPSIKDVILNHQN
jgi:hypothetical protein